MYRVLIFFTKSLCVLQNDSYMHMAVHYLKVCESVENLLESVKIGLFINMCI